MSRQTLTAQPRTETGTAEARHLRHAGRVPGVIYGAGEPVSFSADALEVAAVLRHDATLVELQLQGGGSHTSIVKDYQVHPVRGDLMHLDLQEVRMDQLVRTSVSLEYSGTPVGVKSGGVVTVNTREASIEARPGDIPERIDVDVTALEVGHAMHMGDLTPPDGVTILDDDSIVLVSVTATRASRGAGAAGEGEGAEGEAGAEGDAAGDGEAGGESSES